MKMFCSFLICIFLRAMMLQSHAQTAEDVQLFAKKAYEYTKTYGKEKAIETFNNPRGEFVDGELYIFLFNMDGVIVAHGGNEQLIGRSLLESTDPDGKFFMKDFIRIVKNQGSGWVHYRWLNPDTKTIQPKSSFIQKIEGTNLGIGCGYYKK